MIMKVIYKISLVLIFLMPVMSGFSQGNYLGYDMSGIPQSSYSNPAFRPNAKVFVGIPVISSINIGYYNSSFTFDDIFVQEPGSDSLYLDLSRLANNNQQLNYLSESASIDIISFGFQAGITFLSFGVNTNINTRFFYNTDLVKLAWEGNGSSINEDFILSKSTVFEEHYNEYFAGLNFPVGRYVDVGIRFNFLQGLSSVYSVNRDLELTTNVNDENGVYLDGKTDFEVNISALTYLISDSATLSVKDYFLNYNNKGFSIDLGVNVKINDNFSVQVSGTNLGFITWRSYGKTYSSSEKDIYFDGVNYDFINNESDNSAFDVYLDALDSIFNVKESSKIFSSNLRSGLFANGQYLMVNKKHRFNLLFSGRFLENDFEYAISAGYTYNPFGKFSAKLSYTYMEYAPLNLGAGFFFNFKPFQLYLMADNIIGFFNVFDQKFLDFRFGFNVLIPAKKVIHNNDIPIQKVSY